MTASALSTRGSPEPTPANLSLRAATFTNRRDLPDLLRQICREVSADRYMLIDLVDRPNEPPRIIASNWVYDAIETIGLTLVGRVAQRLTQGQPREAMIAADDQRLLTRHGHAELIGLPLRAGSHRYALLLSAETPGRLVDRAMARARLVCSYALSLLGTAETSGDPQGALSDRERECLYWVSEGKTTEEVAMILGVSPNTANSYLSSAIQRLGAKNRTVAIATAIRRGLI